MPSSSGYATPDNRNVPRTPTMRGFVRLRIGGKLRTNPRGRKSMRQLLRLVGSFALLFVIASAQAQSPAAYPTKSIRFIVPVTTGGPSDIVARLLSDKLATTFGKPVIVDNRPGASNTVGAAIVAKSEPDGYTLLMAAANMATIQV